MKGRARTAHRSASLSALAALAVLAWPGLAAACAVCMGGREDETRVAFLLTTLFLSVLPLAMIGGLAWWLRRRSRRLAAPREGASPAAPLRRASGSL